jgi:hypothetical protein
MKPSRIERKYFPIVGGPLWLPSFGQARGPAATNLYVTFVFVVTLCVRQFTPYNRAQLSHRIFFLETLGMFIAMKSLIALGQCESACG